MVTRLKIDPRGFTLEKDDNGHLVRFDDYKELEQRLKGVSSLCEEAMSNEVAWEKEMAKAVGKDSPVTVAEEIEKLKSANCELQQKLDALAAENAELKKSLKGTVEWCYSDDLPEIPATDAYLNSVRAEALKMAIDHMNNQTSDDCADVTVLPVIEMYKKLISGTHDTTDKEG